MPSTLNALKFMTHKNVVKESRCQGSRHDTNTDTDTRGGFYCNP